MSSGGSRKQSMGVLEWFAREARGKFLPTTPTFPKPHFNLYASNANGTMTGSAGGKLLERRLIELKD